MKAKSARKEAPGLTARANVLKSGELKEFIKASRKGAIESVKAMLKRGADPDVLVESLGSRPLTAAARGGHIDIVRLLLDAGADPNLKDTGLSMPPGGTPLENACENGHLEIAKLLVNRGADMNLKGYWPPLKSAISHGQLEAVRYLLSLGAAWETSWLFQAIATGSVELVCELIKVGADVNYQSDEGNTPLHRAAAHEVPAILALLLERGAKPNVQNHRRKETPLTIAAERGNLEVVRALLSGGADPLLTGPKGQTPEHRARIFRQREVAKFLRDHVKDSQFMLGNASKVAKARERTVAVRKRPSRKIVIPRSKWVKQRGAFGATDFVDFVREWGHPEWVVLAVESPLTKVVTHYCNSFPVVKFLQSAAMKPPASSEKGMAEWMPFVQTLNSKWTVLFRVVCLPIGSQDISQAIGGARLLSKGLRTRALSFLGEDTSGAMQCDLFEAGKSLGTECWENQGSDADSLFKQLGLYIPACYSQKRGDSVWLSVWPSSHSKIESAALVLPKA